MSELPRVCERKIQTWFVSPSKSKHLFEQMYLVKFRNGFRIGAIPHEGYIELLDVASVRGFCACAMIDAA